MTEYKLTPKQNLMRMFDGEIPEYLLKYDFWGWGSGRKKRARTAIPWMNSASSTPPPPRPWAE